MKAIFGIRKSVACPFKIDTSVSSDQFYLVSRSMARISFQCSVINHKTDKNLAGGSPFFLPKLQSNFIGQDSKAATNFPEITFLNHKITYKIVNEYIHLFY